MKDGNLSHPGGKTSRRCGRKRKIYTAFPPMVSPRFRIESKFHFTPLDSDSEFHYLHVEALLDEADALLERCAAARAKRDRLQLEKWKLQVEFDRFFRLDQVQERERQAGLDTLPYERATAESAAENSFETNHKSAAAQLKGLTDDLVASGFNKRMAAHELSAWVSAYPLKDADLRGDDASYTFDGARKSKPEPRGACAVNR